VCLAAKGLPGKSLDASLSPRPATPDGRLRVPSHGRPDTCRDGPSTASGSSEVNHQKQTIEVLLKLEKLTTACSINEEINSNDEARPPAALRDVHCLHPVSQGLHGIRRAGR